MRAGRDAGAAAILPPGQAGSLVHLERPEPADDGPGRAGLAATAATEATDRAEAGPCLHIGPGNAGNEGPAPGLGQFPQAPGAGLPATAATPAEFLKGPGEAVIIAVYGSPGAGRPAVAQAQAAVRTQAGSVIMVRSQTATGRSPPFGDQGTPAQAP